METTEDLTKAQAELRAAFVLEDGAIRYQEFFNFIRSQILAIDPGLKLDRLKVITITSDYPGELNRLGKELGKELVFTDRDDGMSVARIVTISESEERIVLRAQLFEAALREDFSYFFLTLHLLHHELAHIHDHHVLRENLPHLFVRGVSGFRARLTPHWNALWSEYFADRRSAISRPSNFPPSDHKLGEQIRGLRENVRGHVVSYRLHGGLEKLLLLVEGEVHFLFQRIGYVWGASSGLGQKPAEADEDAYSELCNLLGVDESLALWGHMEFMYSTHGSWPGLSIVEPIFKAVATVMRNLGLYYSDLADGRCHVRIP